MEYSREQWEMLFEHGEADLNLLRKIKLSLAENEYGSCSHLDMDKLSQFFFLLSKECAIHHSADDAACVYQSDNKIVFAIPKSKFTLETARIALNEYWKSLPDKKSVSKDQIIDPLFIKQNNENNSVELNLLAWAVETCHQLVLNLDREDKFKKEIRFFFEKEYADLSASFSKEMNLPIDCFNYKSVPSSSNNEIDYLKSAMIETDYFPGVFDILAKHPAWKERYNSIGDRKARAIEALLSQDDLYKINVITSTMPLYIELLAVRLIIGIQRIIDHHLEERSALSGFDKRISDFLSTKTEAVSDCI